MEIPRRQRLKTNNPPGNAEPQLGECFQNNAKATFSRATRPHPAPGRDTRDTQLQRRHPIADTHSFFSQVSHKNGCLAASLSRSFAHPPVAFGSIESEARTGQTVARPSRSGLFSNPEPPGNAEPQLGECFQNNAKATFSRVTRPQPAPGRDSRDTQLQTPPNSRHPFVFQPRRP